jgi:hypothetical protein
MMRGLVGSLAVILLGPGTGNPNVNEPMYWKDAENVLQDLSKFSALYVRYHHW